MIGVLYPDCIVSLKKKGRPALGDRRRDPSRHRGLSWLGLDINRLFRIPQRDPPTPPTHTHTQDVCCVRCGDHACLPHRMPHRLVLFFFHVKLFPLMEMARNTLD